MTPVERELRLIRWLLVGIAGGVVALIGMVAILLDASGVHVRSAAIAFYIALAAAAGGIYVGLDRYHRSSTAPARTRDA